MTLVRTTVHRDVYEKATARADAEGTTLAAVLRAALESYAGSTAPAPVLTKGTWDKVKAWAAADPVRFATYDGPTPINSRERCLLFYTWALSNGFSET